MLFGVILISVLCIFFVISKGSEIYKKHNDEAARKDAEEWWKDRSNKE